MAAGMPASLDLFSTPARDWFEGACAAPTEVQVGGWAAVADGRHTLMCAPTGSGKTLAAGLVIWPERRDSATA